MPKERFHMLVADQVLSRLFTRTGLSSLTAEDRLAYLLGAISPDTLFYDLPRFRFSPTATALHCFEGIAAVALLGPLLTESREAPHPETGMYLLGMAAHLLTDGFWHPLVERMSALALVRSQQSKFNMSGREVHHWLESELEGFWLERAGEEDRFRRVLRRFGSDARHRQACLPCFETVLRRLEGAEMPDTNRICRCLSLQLPLIRQSALPFWARWRDRLLEYPATRFWGTLVVPASSALVVQVRNAFPDAWENPFSNQTMAHSLNFLATHLSSLAARL